MDASCVMTPAWHPRRSGRDQLHRRPPTARHHRGAARSRTVTIYTDDNQAGDTSLAPGIYSTDQVVRWGRGDTPEFSESSIIRITYRVASQTYSVPMRRLEVGWDRFERDMKDAGPPTPDDVSRSLDGTPLDSEAAIVRHMAQLERNGVLTTSGSMFTDLLKVPRTRRRSGHGRPHASDLRPAVSVSDEQEPVVLQRIADVPIVVAALGDFVAAKVIADRLKGHDALPSFGDCSVDRATTPTRSPDTRQIQPEPLPTNPSKRYDPAAGRVP